VLSTKLTLPTRHVRHDDMISRVDSVYLEPCFEDNSGTYTAVISLDPPLGKLEWQDALKRDKAIVVMLKQ
jgi:hypothetical protein